MSRTYRRKQAAWDKWDSIPDWKYHSDGKITMVQVPKWYKVEFLRRPYRARSKMTLKMSIINMQDPVMPVDKKRAQYYW